MDFENLLLKDHWANFNETWHKAPFDEGDSRFNKEGPFSYQKKMIIFLLLLNFIIQT